MNILDSGFAMSLPDIQVGQWVIYRVGWAPLVDPPVKRGRWWVWLGPYLIGRPDHTW